MGGLGVGYNGVSVFITGNIVPAIDQCEPQVVRALEKAGWVVIDQPFAIRVSRQEGILADLRLRNLQNSITVIVVEVKCFSERKSFWDEFYHAVGQYLVYRNALKLLNIESDIYLSVPLAAYTKFFDRRTVQAVLNDVIINIVVVDLEREEVVTWIH